MPCPAAFLSGLGMLCRANAARSLSIGASTVGAIWAVCGMDTAEEL